ncbi:MAG: TetR/AcrR family transcriptional regulator [Desulfobacterales bacterium]
MSGQKNVTPRKYPIQKRSRETVEVILEAATQVFIQMGYSAGTTNRIAERAGVSIGSLYQYFPNKDAILASLAERHLTESFNEIVRMLDAFLNENEGMNRLVEKMIEAMLDMHLKTPELHRVLFEEAPLPEKLWKKLLLFESNIAVIIAEIFQKSNQMELKNPVLSARLLVQMVESMTHWYVLYGQASFQKEEFVYEFSRMIKSCIASQPDHGNRSNTSPP